MKYRECILTSNTARLYVRSFGTGSNLLFVHGACCDSSFFESAAKKLAENYCVTLFDRRGYTRSFRPSDQDYTVSAQAKDIGAVMDYIRGIDRIEHSAEGKQCTVIAHSAGCIYAMELMKTVKEPDGRQLRWILYEPSVTNLFSLPQAYSEAEDMIEGALKEKKYKKALNLLLMFMGPQTLDESETEYAQNDDTLDNSLLFMEHEFLQCFHYIPDTDIMKKKKIIIGIGEKSMDYPFAEPARRLAERLHCETETFPGNHNGPAICPNAFAGKLREILL